jgi:hypothetical protein
MRTTTVRLEIYRPAEQGQSSKGLRWRDARSRQSTVIWLPWEAPSQLFDEQPFAPCEESVCQCGGKLLVFRSRFWRG